MMVENNKKKFWRVFTSANLRVISMIKRGFLALIFTKEWFDEVIDYALKRILNPLKGNLNCLYQPQGIKLWIRGFLICR